MLEPQPQGWAFFCTCISSSEITGGARPWNKDREGTPRGQASYPELPAASTGSCYSMLSPGQSRAHLDCICSSHTRESKDHSVLSALRAAGMKFPKPSLGAENKLFPRFRLGPCQWNGAKATAACAGMVRELSWNQRMVWIGRGKKGHLLSPHPQPQAGTFYKTKFLQALSNLALHTCRLGGEQDCWMENRKTPSNFLALEELRPFF